MLEVSVAVVCRVKSVACSVLLEALVQLVPKSLVVSVVVPVEAVFL